MKKVLLLTLVFVGVLASPAYGKEPGGGGVGTKPAPLPGTFVTWNPDVPPAVLRAGTNGTTVVVMHGGGWLGSYLAAEPVSEHLAQQGFTTLNVEVRQTSLEQEIADLRGAVLWALGNLGGRVFMLGMSSGGNLVIENNDLPVAGIVAWSPPIDLVEGLALKSMGMQTRRALGCVAVDAACIARADALTPHAAGPGAPLWLSFGSSDIVPYSQADEFIAEMQSIGRDITAVQLTTDCHGTNCEPVTLPMTVAWMAAR